MRNCVGGRVAVALAPLAEHPLDPGRTLPVPGDELCLKRRVEQHLIARVVVVSDGRLAQQQLGASGRVIIGRKAKRGPVVIARSLVGIGGSGVVAGLDVRGTRPGQDRRRVLAHVFEQRQRRCVVAGEQLRAVVAPSRQRLEPAGGGQVLSGTVGTTNLRIGDVLGQRVAERELDLAGHRASPQPLHELLPLEGAKQRLHLLLGALFESAQRA